MSVSKDPEVLKDFKEKAVACIHACRQTAAQFQGAVQVQESLSSHHLVIQVIFNMFETRTFHAWIEGEKIVWGTE